MTGISVIVTALMLATATYGVAWAGGGGMGGNHGGGGSVTITNNPVISVTINGNNNAGPIIGNAYQGGIGNPEGLGGGGLGGGGLGGGGLGGGGLGGYHGEGGRVTITNKPVISVTVNGNNNARPIITNAYQGGIGGNHGGGEGDVQPVDNQP
jgi:hypothetical protein